MSKIVKLLAQHNIKPKNLNLYYQALTHPSYNNSNQYDLNYQRLEFLGDALLDAYIGKVLFDVKPKLSEGEMTLIRSHVVNKKQLAELSRTLNLHKMARFGGDASSLYGNEKIQSDLFEALCGAIFIDKGDKELINFLKTNLVKIALDSVGKEMKNPKTLLQEHLQAGQRGDVLYKTTASGKNFDSKVIWHETIYGTGTGSSKKEAEVNAAKAALKKLSGGKDETN